VGFEVLISISLAITSSSLAIRFGSLVGAGGFGPDPVIVIVVGCQRARSRRWPIVSGVVVGCRVMGVVAWLVGCGGKVKR
jgi:hypothetical protein